MKSESNDKIKGTLRTWQVVAVVAAILASFTSSIGVKAQPPHQPPIQIAGIWR